MFFFQPKKIFFIKNNEVKIAYLKKHQGETTTDLEAILSFRDKKKKAHQTIEIKQRISRKQYFRKLKDLLNHIHRGDIYEVNFCQEFYAERAIINPLNVYRRLNAISSPPFATFLKNNNLFFLQKK